MQVTAWPSCNDAYPWDDVAQTPLRQDLEGELRHSVETRRRQDSPSTRRRGRADNMQRGLGTVQREIEERDRRRRIKGWGWGGDLLARNLEQASIQRSVGM
jgi:hypothetical protein